MKMKIIFVVVFVLCSINISPKILAFEEPKSIYTIPNIICVPDEESALQIAEIICKKVYKDQVNFTKYYPIIEFDEKNDEWIIAYLLYETTITGGGGPEIHIKKESAEVTYIGLQA